MSSDSANTAAVSEVSLTNLANPLTSPPPPQKKKKEASSALMSLYDVNQH